MQAAVTAIIAVAGTLLGSVVAYLFQRRAAERAETFAFQQQLRSERTIAYSDFAKAVTEARRGQDNWWFRKHEDQDSQAAHDAQMKAYDLDSVAYHALIRVQLVADSPELVATAQNVFMLTTELKKASKPSELRSDTVRAERALEDFIALASRDVQKHQSSSGPTG